ncbi:hypothetical protein EMIHUDRAFT_195965 [Emiliania huxleyi CCMP1516]|uniref:Metalloendopeptidase n=4 Tax=Emiliania huxleyi TaxID=2903 RepID=A0A0D3J382_EMIH1|nr:hypothetical protein EMIHUDRAFT_195965 [Emiliania huxleyi CCMP1516]EOD17967.1 hypothetical protein EMIHUDRAFT_195965 [Emiliania huxleyi CCMP1516]|eukprot:XP_005770396.1 hypothetical protein EMIHUDRAFT_195965 [Emiliania huxleyi CCMP1516]
MITFVFATLAPPPLLADCHTDRSIGVTSCVRRLGSARLVCVVAAPDRDTCSRSSCASFCAWRDGGIWLTRGGAAVAEPPCGQRCPGATAAADAAAALPAAIGKATAERRSLAWYRKEPKWAGGVVRWFYPTAAQMESLGIRIDVDGNPTGQWAAEEAGVGHFRAVVESAMASIMERTCVCFLEVDPDETNTSSPSNRGRPPDDWYDKSRGILRSSAIDLTWGCGGGGPPALFKKAVVIHELMHSLGTMHEHQRPNRDDYIDVQNIPTEYAGQFTKFDEQDYENAVGEAAWAAEWDWFSIMLYSSYTFAVPGGDPVMLTKNGNQNVSDGDGGYRVVSAGSEFGSNSVLSPKDIARIRALYGCGAVASCAGYAPPPQCRDAVTRGDCVALSSRAESPCRWDGGARNGMGQCGECADAGWDLDAWTVSNGDLIGCAWLAEAGGRLGLPYINLEGSRRFSCDYPGSGTGGERG